MLKTFVFSMTISFALLCLSSCGNSENSNLFESSEEEVVQPKHNFSDYISYEHPELAEMQFKIDCREEKRNGVTVTNCSRSMSLAEANASYKDSIATDYIRSLCYTHPDRVLTYVTTRSSAEGKAIFHIVKWLKNESEFAVLRVYADPPPIPGDAKYETYDPSKGVTTVQLPLLSGNCEPIYKLSGSKIGDTLKIESDIDYNGDCLCNFNISYTYHRVDENIEFVDIAGKIFPAKYELPE